MRRGKPALRFEAESEGPQEWRGQEQRAASGMEIKAEVGRGSAQPEHESRGSARSGIEEDEGH